LLCPLTVPPEFPYPFPPLTPAARAFQERYASRRAFELGRDMYRRHRGRSAEVVQ